MDHKEIAADQNLRMAQKMLDQQGEINQLKVELKRLRADFKRLSEDLELEGGTGQLDSAFRIGLVLDGN